MPIPAYTTYLAERTHNFTGRRWVFEAIHDWLSNPVGPRYFLLTGKPGSGKTAVAARLTQFSRGKVSAPNGLTQLAVDFLSAFHFCSAGDGLSIDSRIFAQSLALQLIKRYPAYAATLIQSSDQPTQFNSSMSIGTVHGCAVVAAFIINNLYLSGSRPQDMFNRALVEPLTRLYAGGFQEPVTILVDALDESLPPTPESGSTILDLLTKLQYLPSPVRFLLTTRPDSRVELQFPEGHRLPLSATEFAQHNDQDIGGYVRRRLKRDRLLASQTKALEPPQITEAVQTITRQAEGNFQYVTFLLNEIARGKPWLEALDKLPEGLEALYHASLQRVITLGKKDWSTAYAPLMGVLSVAQDALTRGQLQRITGQSERTVSECLGDSQQFVEARAAQGRGQERYRLYHRSFIDFLRCPEVGKERLHNRYYLPPEEWHSCIIDTYLTAWGSLEAGLPGLEDPETRDLDGGYGLRYLALHLDGAHRGEELHRLLALQRLVMGSGISEHEPLPDESHPRRWRPVWYTAHEHSGDIAGFADDLERAWRLAQKAVPSHPITTDFADCKAPGPDGSMLPTAKWGKAIGLQCRYALMLASLNSLAANISPVLLAALVKYKRWKFPLALAYALQMPDGAQQAQAFTALVEHVPALGAPEIERMLVAALQMRDEQDPASALVALAPRLSEQQWVQTLTAVQGMPDRYKRGWALAHLAPHLPRTLLAMAHAAAQALPVHHVDSPCHTVRAALTQRRAALGFARKALQEAQGIEHTHWQVMALAGVIPHLPEAQRATWLRRTFVRAQAVEDAFFQAEELTTLALLEVDLPAHKRLGVLQKACEAVLRVPNEGTMVQHVAALAPYLPKDKQSEMLRQAEAAIDDFSAWGQPGHSDGLRALVVCYAKLGDKGGMQRRADKIRNDVERVEVLASAIPELPPAESEEALRETRNVVAGMDRRERPAARALLVDLLPVDERQAELQQALDEARAIDDAEPRLRTLACLAPTLAQSGHSETAQEAVRGLQRLHTEGFTWVILAGQFARAGCLQEALQVIRAIDPGDWALPSALEELAPYLTAPWLPEALHLAHQVRGMDQEKALQPLVLRWAQLGDPARAWQEVQAVEGYLRGDLVAALAQQLPPTTDPSLLQEMLPEAHRLLADWLSADKGEAALAALVPRLAAVDPEQALQEAESLRNWYLRPKALVGVMPYLPTARRSVVLERVLAEADALGEPWQYPRVLMLVAPHLDELLRGEKLRKARAAALGRYDAVKVMMDLAELFPEEEREAVYQDALNAALSEGLEPLKSSDTLVRLALHLSKPQLERLMAALSTIRDDYWEERLHAQMLPRLAELDSPERALREGMQEIRREDCRGTALAELASHLSGPLLQQALDLALALYSENAQAEALEGLARRLDGPLLQQALLAVPKIQNEAARARALAGLAQQLTTLRQPILHTLWGEILRALARRTRAELLGDLQSLVPATAALGGPEALAETFTAICDVGRWWP